MRVLVTGGSGFIGSHIVDELLAARHDVVVLDRAHAAKPSVPVGSIAYRRDDICDMEAVRAAVDGVDAVCHQAAMVGLGTDFGDVVDYVRVNDWGTATLLRALHDAGFAGRFVLAGSMVVYGEGRYRCLDHGLVRPGPRDPELLARHDWEPRCPTCGKSLDPEPVPESTAPDPRNVYAATKLQQEHLCALYGREHRIPVTALRYHNVYGPRMPRDTPYAGVAAIFRSALVAGRAPIVFEDGGQLRDFVHVRDVARANRLALEADVPWHGPLNIASGTPRSVLELATALWHATGEHAPPPQIVPRFRTGDVRHVFASADEAVAQLDFKAEVSFACGIAELAADPVHVQ